MTFSIDQIMLWVGSYFWPFVRITALMAVAPLLSSRSIPIRVKVLFALLVTFAVAPTLPTMPLVDIFTWRGLVVMVQQILIGVAMGTVFVIIFQALVMAGQLVAMGMGLAFSTMVDPNTGSQSPVISQFYTLIATTLFVVLDGHILLIQLVVDSFRTLPLGVDPLSSESFYAVAKFGAHIFSGGVLISLPILTALLLINISMGVMTKAAPQLNVFSIGFAITLLVGFVLLSLNLPQLLPQFQMLIDTAFAFVQKDFYLSPPTIGP